MRLKVILHANGVTLFVYYFNYLASTIIKKMKKLSIVLVISSIVLSGCFTTKTQVGAYRQTQGTPYTYAKGKQVWIFAGLIPIGRTSVATPPDGNCEVVTRFTFGDILISGLTLGIVSTYTIKVKSKQYGTNTGYTSPSSQPTPTQAAQAPPATPVATQSSTNSEPEDKNSSTTSEYQSGEYVYIKNNLGNSFQVKIEYIEGDHAFVVYDNVMGVEKRKKVTLREVSRTP